MQLRDEKGEEMPVQRQRHTVRESAENGVDVMRWMFSRQ
jgi:hypothetical protein